VLNTLLGMSSGDVRRVLTQLRLIGVVFFTSALLAVSAVTHILTGRSVTASLGVAIASSLAIYLYGIWPYRRLRHIPGPEPEPFLGHLPQHLELGLPDFYRKVAKQYGKVAKVFMGRTPVVIVSDPELTKQVGMKLFKSFHDRPTGPKFREDFGLLVVRGEQWKRIRSAIVPTFNDAQLRSFQPAMNEAIERFLHNLERHYARAPDEPLAILPAWSAMTMEVIGSTCFGVRFPTQDDIKEKHPIIQATNDFFRLAQPSNHISLALVRTFPFLAPFVALLAANQVTQILQSLRTMDKVSLEITQKRRSDPKMAEYRDFVTLLLQAQDSDGKPLTDLEIRDQENTFLLAGYETTENVYCKRHNEHYKQLKLSKPHRLAHRETQPQERQPSDDERQWAMGIFFWFACYYFPNKRAKKPLFFSGGRSAFRIALSAAEAESWTCDCVSFFVSVACQLRSSFCESPYCLTKAGEALSLLLSESYLTRNFTIEKI